VAALVLSALLMSTSSDLGVLFAGGKGHEYALYFGLYFWSGVVLYLATAWRVVVERKADPFAAGAAGGLAGPHFGVAADATRGAARA
jgi:hypothetical protein